MNTPPNERANLEQRITQARAALATTAPEDKESAWHALQDAEYDLSVYLFLASDPPPPEPTPAELAAEAAADRAHGASDGEQDARRIGENKPGENGYTLEEYRRICSTYAHAITSRNPSPYQIGYAEAFDRVAEEAGYSPDAMTDDELDEAAEKIAEYLEY